MNVTYSSAPADLELDPTRLSHALNLPGDAAAAGFLPGYATSIYVGGNPVCVSWAGTRKPEENQPVESDTIFLIASLTKPIVCAGALLLLEDGAFSLYQKVRHFIPEFCGDSRDDVQLIHLFTHTSGLPDQLPESKKLRRSQAPISEFVKATCSTELLFRPGTSVSYQSMGILLLGEIIERISGTPLRAYLQERLFDPVGMQDTTLGLPLSGMNRSAYSLDAPFAAESNDVGDDWNTDYWRDFGSPWGGLHSTVADLSRFLSHMLGDLEGPMSRALRSAMVRDRIADMTGIPADKKVTDRWGLGWSLASPAFGSLVSPATFGHRGATGAMFWADPETHLSCVLLTNQPCLWRDAPPEWQDLAPRFSNAVAASVT